MVLIDYLLLVTADHSRLVLIIANHVTIVVNDN